MELTDKVMRRQDLIAVPMGDETVMMDVVTGKYFKLTGVGGVIWDMIEEPVLVSDLIEKLLGEYEVSREVCESQTLEFLCDMCAQGVIVVN